MKFHKILKKNICHAIILGFISQLCGTYALATEHSAPKPLDSQEYILDALTLDPLIEDAQLKHNELMQQKIENIKDLINQCCEDQNELINRKFNKQNELIEDQTNSIGNKIHAQNVLIKDQTEILNHKLHAQNNLIEEQTDIIVHELHKNDLLNNDGLLEKQTTEIKHKINQQTDTLVRKIKRILHEQPEIILKEISHIIRNELTNAPCDLADLTETITSCCDDLADDIFTTQSIIIDCCNETHSLIEECCEATHSLIEECCMQTQSLIEECCVQTQSLLKTVLQQVCEDTCWKLAVNETGSSLNNFTQSQGTWTTDGAQISTTVTSGNFNFLQYNFPVQQTYQVVEFEIEFPNSQLANQNQLLGFPKQLPNQEVVGGILLEWNGSSAIAAGPLTFYFVFNTDASGQIVPGTSKFSFEVFDGGGGTGQMNFPSLALDTYYKVTCVIAPYNLVSIYIDDILVAKTNYGTSWSNQVFGGYIGFWAYSGAVNYKNLKSWSALPFFL